MNDFPLPKETDDIVHIRVVRQAQDVVVGKAGLLLRSQILGQIRDNVARDLHGGGRPGIARGELGIYASGVVHKISVESRSFDLVIIQVSSELMDQSAYHFQVTKFLRTY